MSDASLSLSQTLSYDQQEVSHTTWPHTCNHTPWCGQIASGWIYLCRQYCCIHLIFKRLWVLQYQWLLYSHTAWIKKVSDADISIIQFDPTNDRMFVTLSLCFITWLEQITIGSEWQCLSFSWYLLCYTKWTGSEWKHDLPWQPMSHFITWPIESGWSWLFLPWAITFFVPQKVINYTMCCGIHLITSYTVCEWKCTFFKRI